MELDVVFPHSQRPPQAGSLVLLAQDLQGWSSLCHLASAAQSDPSGTLPVSIDLLACHNRGLICLSGGSRGPLDPLALQVRSTPALPDSRSPAADLPRPVICPAPASIAVYASRVDKLASSAREAGLPVVAAQSIYTFPPSRQACTAP